MTDGFEASDVPALRRDLLEWIRDGRGLAFHARMSHSAGTMLGQPEYDGHPGMMRAYAEMLVAQETRTLADAELYFVTAEMTELVQTAAADLPAFPPDAGDFPTPAGLIVYETPLVHYERSELTALVIDGRLAFDPGDGREQVGVSACTWGPYDAGGQWRHGGVWMSFYRNRAEMLAKLHHDRDRDNLRDIVTRLVPDNEYGIQFTADQAGKASLEERLAETDKPAYTSYWAKHLMATLLLMRQPLVYQRAEPIRRGLRRQLERSGYPTGDICILDARPRQYTTVPRDETGPAPEQAGTEEGGRKLSVRFPVRGFWRNQWYPSRGVHRPKWIDPHWRGPEDAPITHPERVRVLRHHPDQETPHAQADA
ncbi:hypothetical protein ACQEVF_25180 [Nonomuraea polychroma]|uniref:hypothetical protein n=1 Tax=Nonomuraea polychroma TaxID=46176 RepID=UPI003D91FFFE